MIIIRRFFCFYACHNEPCHSQTLPKEDKKKHINHATHLLSSVEINIYSPEISNFCYTKKV